MTPEQRIKLTDKELMEAYSLISHVGLEELAYVYGKGGKKHGLNSWKENLIPMEKLYGRILGHTRRRLEGEVYDQEDGQMHMGSVAWAAFAIMHYDRGGR